MSGVRGFAERYRLLRTAVWTLLCGGIVGIAVWTIGPVRLLRTAASADRSTVAVVVALSLAALVLRGVVLWVVLHAVGTPVSVGWAIVTYFAVALVNTVVPSGGAGGTPVAGLVIARSARAEYEVGVVAALTITTLNNLMVGAFGVLGVLFLVASGGIDDVSGASVVGVGLFSLAAIVGVGLWAARHRIGDGAVGVAVSRRLDRSLPWSLPDRAAVKRHVREFGRAADRVVTGSWRRLAALVGLAAAAHLSSVLALLFAFDALAIPVSLGVLFAVVPTAVLTAVVPAPGAGGSVEVVLSTLLSVATGNSLAAVGSAVAIYRVAGYASRLLLGSLSLGALLLFGRLQSSASA